MKKISLLALPLIAVFALSGCGGSSTTGGETYGDVRVITVESPDGDPIVCVVYEGYKAGGLDCDFEGAQ